MAKYPAMTTTNAGLNVIGEANTTGVAVIFTKIVAGDGDVPEGTSIADLTSVISPHLEIATVHGENLGNGQYQLKGTLDNSTLETGFRAKEIGVYAKAGEDGEENLFAYTNGGNYTDYIPDKRTPIDAQDFYIDIVVGNANEVEIIVSDENYVTREDVDILIGDHDAKYESHRDVYGKFIRQKSTAYSVGDVVYLPNLGAKLYLECTAGGTTDSSYLTITSPVVNMLVTDGTVTWTIRKIGSGGGEAVGVIKAFAGNGDIPSGYLLCDGAAYSRTAFPDLFACIGTDYGSGDGSTTFNVPDSNQAKRFLQGDTVAGQTKAAGLPNITGTLKLGNNSWLRSYTDGCFGGGETTPVPGNSPNGGAATFNGPQFNASLSNPIYGNSTTVQPNALTTRYIIKAFDGQTADSALIDITQYANELAGKADRSLSNLTATGLEKLIKSASIADNGYLTLENGLIIQWGRCITNTAATTITYYPIAFPNACLALTVTPGNASSEDVTVTISSNLTIPNDRFAWVAWKANAYVTIVGNASISYIAIGY